MKISPKTHRPPAPLTEAMDVIRKILKLLGFSSQTFNAGLDVARPPTAVARDVALAKLLTEFRSKVRYECIEELRSKDSNEKNKELARSVLNECDEVRHLSDRAGLKLLDDKIEKENRSSWRWCNPKD